MPGKDDGASSGGDSLELSLRMWVNSVLPADMSLEKLNDALDTPLVVPLFVQVLAGSEIKGLLEDPSPWSETDRARNWNASIAFLRERGCSVAATDSAARFFWQLALHFLIEVQFRGATVPARAAGAETEDEALAALEAAAQRWLAAASGAAPAAAPLLGVGGARALLALVGRAWPEAAIDAGRVAAEQGEGEAAALALSIAHRRWGVPPALRAAELAAGRPDRRAALLYLAALKARLPPPAPDAAPAADAGAGSASDAGPALAAEAQKEGPAPEGGAGPRRGAEAGRGAGAGGQRPAPMLDREVGQAPAGDEGDGEARGPGELDEAGDPGAVQAGVEDGSEKPPARGDSAAPSRAASASEAARTLEPFPRTSAAGDGARAPGGMLERCAGCFGALARPRLLDCLHVFCAACADRAAVGRSVCCPACQLPTELRAPQRKGLKGSAELDVSAALPPLRAVLAGEATPCGNCDARPAALWCDECQAGLCTPCAPPPPLSY